MTFRLLPFSHGQSFTGRTYIATCWELPIDSKQVKEQSALQLTLLTALSFAEFFKHVAEE